MKLAVVAQDFPPSRGGIQTYVRELATHWSTLTEHLLVLAPAARSTSWADARLPFPVRRVRSSSNGFFAGSIPALLELGPEWVTFHGQWPSSLGAQALHRAGRLGPTFVAAHGRELLLQPWPRPAQAIYDATRRHAFRAARGVFAVSAYTAELARALGAADVVVQGNGTDPNRFCPGDGANLRARFGLEGKLLYLAVTRLVVRKGIDVVLEALAATRVRIPNACLVVVGDGPESGRLRARCAELGLEAAVLFRAAVDDAELLAWYRCADVFVLPSRSDPPDVEGFGIAYLEASACELPVIGPHEGGPVDAIADGVTGVLVDPRSSSSVAAAMIQLGAAPELRRNFGRAGRERVVSSATWRHASARLWQAMVERLP